jgi:hypothetical protein
MAPSAHNGYLKGEIQHFSEEKNWPSEAVESWRSPRRIRSSSGSKCRLKSFNRLFHLIVSHHQWGTEAKRVAMDPA